MKTLFAVLALVVGASCVTETSPEPQVHYIEPDFTSTITGARDGLIRGDLGPMTDLDIVATPQAWDDGTYLAAEISTQVDDQHAVMMFLSVSGHEGLFEPGVIRHFARDNFENVNVLGCVGQAVGTYDIYDAPADEVDLAVSAVDKTSDVQVDLTATWLIERAGEETVAKIATSRFILER